MTKLQKIYREIRRYMTSEEARYAAPELLQTLGAMMIVGTRNPERDLSPPDADDLQCDWCGAGIEVRIESEGARAFGITVKPTFTCEDCFTGKDDGPCFDDLQLAEEYEADQEAERVHQINEQHREKIRWG